MSVSNARPVAGAIGAAGVSAAGPLGSTHSLREAATFVALSVGLAAVSSAAAATLGAGLQFVLALGPLAIAIVLSWRSRTVRRLLSSAVHRPSHRRWYLAIAIPVVASLAVVPVAMLLGLPTAGLFGNLTPTVFILPFVVLLPAFAEEIAWRGYAVPRMLTAFSPLATGLLIAIPWSAMHLGLYLAGQPYEGSAGWPSILSVAAMSVLGTWIYVRTGGSVLVVGLFHAAFNAATPLTWSVDPDAAWAIRPVILSLAAVAVVLLGGMRPPSVAAGR